jgi:hypothetical protein
MLNLLKPEVRYVDLGKCAKGEPADVCLHFHPKMREPILGTMWVKTTPVQRFIRHTFNGPVFETENSIYMPTPDDAVGEVHAAMKAAPVC